MKTIKSVNIKCVLCRLIVIAVQNFVIFGSLSLSSMFHNSVAVTYLGESIVVNLGELLATAKPTPDKKALRYGFHRTKECHNFEMAFLCVQKCIDLGYDVAHADKKCVCTCYRNSVKAKYTSKKTNVTKWRHGAPTTKLPIWAQTTKKHIDSAESIYKDNMDNNEYFGENQLDNTTKLNDLSGNGTEVIGDNVAGVNGTETVSDNTAEGGGDKPATGNGDEPATGGDKPTEGGDAPTEGGDTPAEGGETPAEEVTLPENTQAADGEPTGNNENAAADTTIGA